MKTVLLVHGYNGVPPIYDYFTRELTRLGYEVITPDFPTREAISFASYSAVFDQYQAVLAAQPIIVAHSVGNELTLKYISSHDYKLDAFIGLAGFARPFVTEGRDDLNRVLGSISVSDEEKQRFVELAQKRYAVYSDDDPTVPLDHLQEFAADIQAEPVLLSGVGHMGGKSGVTELPAVLDLIWQQTMRLLFTIDAKNYDPKGQVYTRHSGRCITMKDGKIALVHSQKYDYYKFPGGGIEAGETGAAAMVRETREEAGLTVLEDSIRPFGYVHRVQQSLDPRHQADIFVQDNFYYLCDVSDDVTSQTLDDYEADEHFTLEWVYPEVAIAANLRKDHGPKDRNMITREARVLALLLAEGYLG